MPAALNMRALEGITLGEHYRLVRFLDEGAFGAVFLAAQLAYGGTLREVAIKVAKRPMSDDEARRAFADGLLMTQIAERTTDLRIREHFVQVHDAGRCPPGGPLADHPYLVMELLDGCLKKALRLGCFPLTRAMDYFEQLLDAMAFMHGGEGREHAPVAHRDLKPANVLLSRRARERDLLKVTDFGLAVEVDTRLGWVESGGDMAYMAPEGFSHNICSPQSDVYALGLIFFEMITGSNPFAEVGVHLRGNDAAQRAEIRRLHLEARHLERFAALADHPELRSRPALIRVIRTALAHDMHERTYTNAQELRGAWQAAIGTTPPPVTPPPGNVPAWEQVRRLTSDAERLLAVGSEAEAEACLQKAMAINRDANRVPNRMMVGKTYLMWVDCLLRSGRLKEAQEVAAEGHGRRRCRSTGLAMAACYRALGSPAAAQLEKQAEEANDHE